MLGAFSIDTYLPSFPSIAAEFHLGVDAVQQTLTVFLLAMAVMTLFHGTLSDAVGRRPVILGSLAIYLAASICAFLANSFSWLLFCRLLQGMSAGAGMVVGRAMVRDRFSGPDAQTVMSYTTIVFGLAPVVAPILGGWLEVVSGWRSVFVFLAVVGFLLLVACAFKLPESLPLARRSPLRLRATLKDYATVGSDARFLLQSISIALAASALFLYISSAPVFVLQILHLPGDLVRLALFSHDYGNHGRFVSGRSRCTFLVPRSDHSDRISRYGRRSSSQCTLRRVLHSCHSLGRCPDHALHVRHGSRIAGHDHSDAGPLSRPARLGRIAPVRFRHGRFFNLFRFAGASPLWECFQAGMRGLSRPSRQRCVLVLWTALQKNCKAFRMTGTSTRAFGSPPAYSTGCDR